MMQNQNQNEKPKNQVSVLRDYLSSKEVTSAINKVLPKFLTADKILSIVLSEVRKTPKLLECDKISFTNAIVECTQLGLVPGALFGQAYLIPYNKKEKIEGKWVEKTICTLMPGYRGYVVLAERAGTSLTAHAVFTNDKYECRLGTVQQIEHIPADHDRGELKCVYAVAKSQRIDKKTGNIQIFNKIDHLTLDDIAKARAYSKCPDKFWGTINDDTKHYVEMARKTGVKRLGKYLDLTPEFNQLCEIDNNIDSGIVLDGTFTKEEEDKQSAIPQNKKLLEELKNNGNNQKQETIF